MIAFYGAAYVPSSLFQVVYRPYAWATHFDQTVVTIFVYKGVAYDHQVWFSAGFRSHFCGEHAALD